MRNALRVKRVPRAVGVALGVILLVGGLTLAQTIITRDQPASAVVATLTIDETLVLYRPSSTTSTVPDLANPLSSTAILSFGNVAVDAFGNICRSLVIKIRRHKVGPLRQEFNLLFQRQRRVI